MSLVEIPGAIPVKRGRPPIGEVAATPVQRQHKLRAVKRANRLKHIAVLDMETDPFTEGSEREIFPFCAELYSDQFGAIVIWEENYETLVEKIYAQIEMLPDSYTIYAHNGGKFDFMFFVHKLRGKIRFKGRSIMSARIGPHELRDSLHVLPEKLAAWKKDSFDYAKMLKCNRRKFRDEILAYMHSDCVYLFDFIKRFVTEFGLKISIGQAAFTELKKFYTITPIKEKMDTALRPYFLGGRVECIAGMGLFESRPWQKPYKLYDVNAMYPYVMATRKHPVGAEYLWHRGEPNENTIFLDLECKSYGAFFRRLEDGGISTEDHFGRFWTTIWEYNTAVRFGLIDAVSIKWCIDCQTRTDFGKFVIPIYNRRQIIKAELHRLRQEGKQDTPEYEELNKEGIFLKYLQNNAYGKCAQNPRKYKEYFYTDHGVKPNGEWFNFLDGADDDTIHEYSMPIERCELFDVWARPSPGHRFHNVGTAASITGAARALLLEAQMLAVDPIYCDTDSLICRDLNGLELSETKLGAWKLEETFDRVIIAGKKEYVCEVAGKSDCEERRLKVRCKGADLRDRPRDRNGIEKPDPTPEEWRISNALTWQKYMDLLDGKIIEAMNRAPTFNKTGAQHYIRRRIRATAPLRESFQGRKVHRGTTSIQNSVGKFPT